MFERKREKKERKAYRIKTGAQREKDQDVPEKERGVMTLAYMQT